MFNLRNIERERGAIEWNFYFAMVVKLKYIQFFKKNFSESKKKKTKNREEKNLSFLKHLLVLTIVVSLIERNFVHPTQTIS